MTFDFRIIISNAYPRFSWQAYRAYGGDYCAQLSLYWFIFSTAISIPRIKSQFAKDAEHIAGPKQ